MLTLVTGVGKKGQVGEAVAAALTARGDTMVLVSRSRQDVEARAAELAGAGRRAFAYACDLADAEAVRRLAARVAQEHGTRLDALVNLAGGFEFSGPVGDSEPAVTAAAVQMNFTTAYIVTRAFYGAVRAARGSIVYFASEAVLEGARTSGMSAYVAAKSAVVALMRSVADEGRAHGVRANALAPAAIRTGENEAALAKDTRYVERDDVAAAVAFLTSPAAAAVSGQVIRLR